MKILKTILICAVASTAISQGTETLLFNIDNAAGTKASGNVYSNIYWNSLTPPKQGPGNDLRVGSFNATVTEGCGMEVGKIYTSTGKEIRDNLTWTALNAVSSGGGLWNTIGTPGTTPSTYQEIPTEVSSTSLSFNNAANFTFTIGGLQAGQTYTLSFGGNSGMGQTTQIKYTFSGTYANLQGTGGTISNNIFTVTNPSTTAYALQIDLTANDSGQIIFSGTRIGSNSSNVNMTYMSLTGDWNLVPEPSSYALGLFGLAGLAMRRRRA